MTREEAIKILEQEQWYMGRYSKEYAEAYDMAIEALRQPINEDWERYSDFLWKEAYERGKQDALKGGDKYDK